MTEHADEPHWSRIGEQTSFCGIRFMRFLFGTAGPGLFHAVLKPVLLAYWLTNPRLRRDLKLYHERARATLLAQLDGASPEEHEAIHALSLVRREPGCRTAIEHLGIFAETILDKFESVMPQAASGGGKARSRLTLDIENDGVFHADPPHRGAIILTSHMGCQELLSREAGFNTEHEIVVLRHTGHAARFQELLEEAKSKSDVAQETPSEASKKAPVTFFEVGELTPALAMELSDRVERGAYIVLAGDRTPIGSEKASTRINFLGAEASFPTGGALIALLLKCPLRMMTCTRVSGPAQNTLKHERRYRVRFDSIDEAPAVPKTLTKGKGVDGLTPRERWCRYAMTKYAEKLQTQVCRSPYDWFNFFDFWK